jgi:hypothetical protein
VNFEGFQLIENENDEWKVTGIVFENLYPKEKYLMNIMIWKLVLLINISGSDRREKIFPGEFSGI